MSRGEPVPVGTETPTPQGYTLVKTEDGWKLKHKVVIEEKLGRPVKSTERVYFIDNDRTNCHPDNLEVRAISPKSTARLEARLQHIEEQAQEIRRELEERNELEAEAS